jgi:hypothetical protein
VRYTGIRNNSATKLSGMKQLPLDLLTFHSIYEKRYIAVFLGSPLFLNTLNVLH